MVFGVLIIFVGYERREVSVVSMLVLAANDVECCVVLCMFSVQIFFCSSSNAKCTHEEGTYLVVGRRIDCSMFGCDMHRRSIEKVQLQGREGQKQSLCRR